MGGNLSLPSPFPYFGGKRKVAAQVWQRFGKVQNYVEPFAGSAAALFARPLPFSGNETINDVDGMVANFWRAVKLHPEETAEHADNPVNENDLHARHAWLVGQKETIAPRLEGDPEWCEPPEEVVSRCKVCRLREPHECLAGGEYRRGESVIHDGRRWT